MAHRIRTLILLCFAAFILHADGLKRDTLAWKIYQNECGANPEKLIHWNRGETFPSLGIGHFIWYPAGVHERFSESFPRLIAFLKKAGATPPAWLEGACPWPDREAMQKDPRLPSLRTFLIQTMPLQARFLEHQLNRALSHMTHNALPQERAHILRVYNTLRQSIQGRYALLDYRNFKGEGTNPTERYKGKGWGLKQVLLCIPETNASVEMFTACAWKLLQQRVDNAPPQRHEEHWLKGWYNRIQTYTAP